jgi:hypothetical protein
MKRWQGGANDRSAKASGLVSFLEDLDDFPWICLMEDFAAFLHLFIETYRGILHALVGFLGAADKQEMLTAGNALMAVLIVQSDSQKADHAGLAVLAFLTHSTRSGKL